MHKQLNYKGKLYSIRAFVFDFDGVLSDGGVWVINNEIVRRTDVKDGYAIQYAAKKGYTIAVISGATAPSIIQRMNSLGVTQVFMGCTNKLETYELFLQENGLQEEEVVVVGDDIPDFQMMQRCGVSVCPADAALEIKEVADYISLFPGGKGCARDILEQVMRLQGRWFHADAVNW
ncbi:MAG: HAD hydrolase family protein [Bacteroidales bacterium]|nr:HAD hydrolase family protein [Bacteroidales bacterium]